MTPWKMFCVINDAEKVVVDAGRNCASEETTLTGKLKLKDVTAVKEQSTNSISISDGSLIFIADIIADKVTRLALIPYVEESTKVVSCTLNRKVDVSTVTFFALRTEGPVTSLITLDLTSTKTLPPDPNGQFCEPTKLAAVEFVMVAFRLRTLLRVDIYSRLP